MLITHFYASFFMNYGSYTFSGYIAFFDYIGIALIAYSYRSWRITGQLWQKVMLVIVILLPAASLAYLYPPKMDFLIKILSFPLPIPRLKGFSIPFRPTNILAILQFKLGISSQTLNWLLPTLTGLSLGLLTILLAWLISRISKMNATLLLAACGLLAFGYFLAPSSLLGKGHPELTCSFDVLEANESIGNKLPL